MTNQSPREPGNIKGPKTENGARKQRGFTKIQEKSKRTDGLENLDGAHIAPVVKVSLNPAEIEGEFPEFHECEYDETYLEEPPITIVVNAVNEDDDSHNASKMIIIGVAVLFLGQIAINAVDAFMCDDEPPVEEVCPPSIENACAATDHVHIWADTSCLSCHHNPHENMNADVGGDDIFTLDDAVNSDLIVIPTSP